MHKFERHPYAVSYVLDLAVRTLERTLRSDFVNSVQQAAALYNSIRNRAQRSGNQQPQQQRPQQRPSEGSMRREDYMLQQVLSISALNKDLFSAVLREMILQQHKQQDEPPEPAPKKKGASKTPVIHFRTLSDVPFTNLFPASSHLSLPFTNLFPTSSHPSLLSPLN